MHYWHQVTQQQNLTHSGCSSLLFHLKHNYVNVTLVGGRAECIGKNTVIVIYFILFFNFLCHASSEHKICVQH